MTNPKKSIKKKLWLNQMKIINKRSINALHLIPKFNLISFNIDYKYCLI